MALHEDDESMNANNIQDVMGEVDETTEEEIIPGPVIFNENVEEDEEENDMEVEVNSNNLCAQEKQFSKLLSHC